MTQPNEQDREAARAIKIGICACSGQPEYTCIKHEAIATALANERARADARYSELLAFFGATEDSDGRIEIDMKKYHAAHRCEEHRKTPWREHKDLDRCVPCLHAEVTNAYARGRDEAKAEGKKLYSRLVQLAARIIQHKGFLSPFPEDNPASKKVLKVAEHQNEQCRLWAIEAREIADAILAPASGSTVEQQVRAEIAEAVKAMPQRHFAYSEHGTYVRFSDVLAIIERGEK